MHQGCRAASKAGILPHFRAEQSAAPDCLQPTLVPRFGFRQQVSASVGPLSVTRYTGEQKRIPAMIDWKWKLIPIPPADILTGAQTLPIGTTRVIFDLTHDWMSCERYLSWAKDCLIQDNDFGWDAAVAYSKRAACRQIDAIVVCNHLGHFLSATYPVKIEMLSEIDVHVPDIIQELIINPRNEIEHGYKVSTREQARHAVQLADLFLKAVSMEAGRKAIVAINWSVDMRYEARSTPDEKFERIDFSMAHYHASMLLVDVSNPVHRVLILHPRDEEVLLAPLTDFNRAEAVQLARDTQKTLRC
jgi:hypothetical protein